MNIFSIQLQQLLQSRDKSVVEMAHYCHCDRTTIYKFLHGTRLPGSTDIVRNMASFLCLSEAETSSLLRAYKISVLGDQVFYQQEQVLQLFSFFHSRKLELATAMRSRNAYSCHELFSVKTGSAFSLSGKKQPAFMVEGKSNVLFFIHKLISHTDGTIRLLMQGNVHDLLFFPPEITPPYENNSTSASNDPDSSLFSSSERNIEHIILFEHDEKEIGSSVSEGPIAAYNIGLIASALYCSLKCSYYQSFYLYHTNVSESIAASAFPFYLLTDCMCVQLTSDLTSGLVITDSQMLRPFQQEFSELKKKSFPLFCRQLEPADYLNSLPDSEIEQGEQYYIYQPGPYMGSIMTPDLIQKIVSPQFAADEQLLAAYAARISSFTQRSSDRVCKHILTPEGIQHFLDTGSMPEFPCDVYTPPAPDLRRHMLRDYLNHVISKNQLILLRRPLSDPETGLCMSLSNHYVYFSYNSDFASPAFFLMAEPSSVKAFLTFFQTLDSDMIYSEEEMKRIVRNLLE